MKLAERLRRATHSAVFALSLGGVMCACGMERNSEKIASLGGHITNSETTHDLSSVVALMSFDHIMCTGVVVGPRLVLTAAHCLRGSRPERIVYGGADATRTSVEVIKTWAHPEYRVGSPDHDLAMLLTSIPLLVPSLTMNTEVLDTSWLNQDVMVAGFGRIMRDDAGPYDKRQGMSTLIELSEQTLRLRPSPSLPCAGDSGGPVLDVSGRLVLGIISKGDENCSEWSRAVRLDAEFKRFVNPLLERVGRTRGGTGDSCLVGENCVSGNCFIPAEAPDFGYCASSCDTDDVCSFGMRCMNRVCRYSIEPGAIGARCASASDCQFQMCAAVSSELETCSKLCFPDGSLTCPAGTECTQLADNSGTYGCRLSRAPDTGEVATSGCSMICNAHRASWRAIDLLGLSGLFLLGRRSRRKRAN